MRAGALLMFKFGGSRLQHEPGICAAAHVTCAPAENGLGTWILRYEPDAPMTRHLMRSPIVGRKRARVVSRSFGAFIQVVHSGGEPYSRSCLAPERPGARGLRGDQPITRGLLILKEPLDKILAETKEIRGKAPARRGPIALVQSESDR